MKGLKNHMGDNAHSNIDSLIVQSKLQEMMKMAGGGMVDKKKYGYQQGGSILAGLLGSLGTEKSRESLARQDNDSMKGLLGMKGLFDMRGLLGRFGMKKSAGADIESDAPLAEDQIDSPMINMDDVVSNVQSRNALSDFQKQQLDAGVKITPRTYSERIKERNRNLREEHGKDWMDKFDFQELKSMIPQYQQGGQASPDPLNIDARSANPSMYQGSVVQGAGGMLPMQGNPLDSLNPKDSLNVINEALEQLKSMKANTLMDTLKALEPEQEPELLDSRGSYFDSLGSELDSRVKFPVMKGDKKPMDFMQNFLYNTPR